MSETRIQTPAPWRWQSFNGGKTMFLGTPDRGRLVVMDFVRQGMRNAAPRFAIRWREDIGGILEPATLDEIESFPDARLIAAAPDLLAACEAMLSAMKNHRVQTTIANAGVPVLLIFGPIMDQVTRAIAKATPPLAGRSAGGANA